MDITLLAPQLQKIQSLSQFISNLSVTTRSHISSPETMKVAAESLQSASCKLMTAIDEMDINVNELDQ